MRKYFIYIILFMLLFSSSVWGATYTLTEAMGEIITESVISGGGTVAPGDTIILGSSGSPRTSPIYFSGITGGDGNPVVITNPADAKATITGDTASWGSSIFFTDCRYIKLSGDNYGSETYGIKITGGTNGIRFRDSRNWEVAYFEITDSGLGVVQNNNSWTGTSPENPMLIPGVKIYNFYIHDITLQEGIYLGKTEVGNHPQFVAIEIYDGIIENSYWDCLQLKHTTNSANKIYGLELTNCGTAKATGQEFGATFGSEAKYVEFFGNEIDTTGHNAFNVDDDADGPINAHDNLIINAGENGFKFTSDYAHQVVNNTIINSGAWAIKSFAGYTSGALKYNLMAGNTSGGILSDYSTQTDNRTAASVDTEGFVDAGGGDYHLTDTAPATDAGVGLGFSVLDFDGNTRPFGSTAPDIGAYEFESIAFNPDPVDAGTGVPIDKTFNWSNPDGTTTIDMFLEQANPPTVKVIDDGVVETYNPPADFGYNETWYWKINNTHGGGEETGDIWSLTTQGFPPTKASGKYSKGGMELKREAGGAPIK